MYRDIQQLANAIDTIIAYIDEERRFQFVNHAYEMFVDKPAVDILGKRVDEILDSESAEYVKPLHQRALNGEHVEYEQTITLANGRKRILNTRYVPMHDADSGKVSGFYAIIDDITSYISATDLMRTVHKIINQPEKKRKGKVISQLLELGNSYLQTEIGLVSEVDGNDYIVKYSDAIGQPIEPETHFPLGNTYCSVTLAEERVIAVTEAAKSAFFKGHPCYQTFELETYLGVPLTIDGELWGTLSFSSAAQRELPFDALEIELISLVASAIETILAEKRRLDELRQLAYFDPLTELSNRTSAIYQINERLKKQRQQGTPFYVAIADADHFKTINDRYGHQAGDRVLRKLAQVLKANIREHDLAARLGGEEFVLLIDSDNVAVAHKALERCRQQVHDNPVTLDDGTEIKYTISVGMTRTADKDEFLQIYQRADQALYRAKGAGRNCIVSAD